MHRLNEIIVLLRQIKEAVYVLAQAAALKREHEARQRREYERLKAIFEG